ncbi:unnamed protein product [Clonostachys rosea]|uniref:Uncharacterized protein n=1 Tax=Bionectria ochroleuca TaxID=29856 RepID=A0ABY6UNK8_BIOOC|nr:unnamed protein product [Clonostachys rosea]
MHVYQNQHEIIVSSSKKGGPDLHLDVKNASGRKLLEDCMKKWRGEDRANPTHTNEAACGEFTGVHIMGQLHKGKIPDENTQMVAVHRPAPGAKEKEEIKKNKGIRRPATKEDLVIQPPCDGGRGGCASIPTLTGAEVASKETTEKDYDLTGSEFSTHALGPYEEDPAAKKKQDEEKLELEKYRKDHKARMQAELKAKKQRDKQEAVARAKANYEKAKQAEKKQHGQS